MGRRYTTCPRCFSPLQRSTSWNGTPSEFWFECTKCNTYINTYVPQEHQARYHSDGHTYKGNFGGYGTGKTLTSREEVYKHMLLTPNANILIGANVSSQYEQTLKRELESDIPRDFVKYYSVQKAYMDLINGARIMYRPLSEPDTLRSYNLTMFVAVEASEMPTESYAQLKTRLRNTAAAKQATDELGNPRFTKGDNGIEVPVWEVDWRVGVIESNPDSGWIRSEVLMIADVIEKHGTVLDNYRQNEIEKDPSTSAHVSSTDANKFLPSTFIEEICRNKPHWWVSRFVYGSFSYAEGLVYPSAMSRICKTFEPPNYWKRVIAFDYGLSDAAHFLFGAIDPYKNLLYIYKEARCHNLNVQDLAKIYFSNTQDIPSGGLAFAPLIDPKSGMKRDYDKRSLADHFLEYGIAFEAGYINIDARVYRLNTYLETGRLLIMDCCVYLIEELKDYKFRPKTLDDKSNHNDKPMDKNNHAINPLEWIVMRLPADPKNLTYGVYNSRGEDLTEHISPRDLILPYALRDDPKSEDEEWA